MDTMDVIRRGKIMATILDAQSQAYRLANPEVVFSPDMAICRKWVELKRQGTYIGVPIGPEMAMDDGTVAQAFTSGVVLVWQGGDQVTVE